MINGQTVLAVIPARGGSKRVPRKNVRDFRGKPLFQWASDAAQQSQYIDTLIISTDDAEIAFMAETLEIQIMVRPAELATDSASSEDVLRYCLEVHPSDWVVLLQPTSPLRTSEDIDACIERAQMGYGCISVDSRGETNGAVYVATAEWLAAHDFNHMGLMKYRMPDERSLDINTEADLFDQAYEDMLFSSVQ